ncbi:hypothetical protein TRFO_23084 [Tritrichomonas foetus]|uniref:CYRIA/CYRIB Rac1 binding domain-containing protein n=1 Tax=Tritrichomonas foetus TaxID=1144522 RepID=A0A1J4KFL0_9EUKA|nr:hypothetical protein TRFO_23084 [Tritrichomonas foetus]|eukprot:OHT08406.1 hypothetical protein TRFO_23084 [Tritrichomonas foetus]
MLNYVHVPPVNEIKAWSQLDVMPIVETEPDAVPLPNVLRYPCNDNFNRLLETKIDLPSKSIAIIIKQLDGHIKNVDSYIAEFYSRRGLTRPLQSYIQRLKGEQNTTETPMQFKTEEAKMLANAFFIPQLEYLKRVKNDCTEIASFITSIFSEEKIWKEGQYCDVLLDNICILLYKLTALEQLAPSKKGIINDLSTFNALSNNSSQSRDAMEIRMWISDFHSSTSLLLGSLSKLEPELTVIIFNIIFEYITKQLEEDNFLIPDMQYSYIAALIFMVNFYEKQKKIEEDSMKSKKKPKYKIKPLKEKVKIFLINLCELHPNIPLIFEFAGQTNANIPPELLKLSKSSSSYAPNLTNYSLDDITNKLHRLTQDFSKILALTKIPKSKTIENSKKLVDILPKILHIIALGMNNTREILAQILSHPPQTPEGTNMKPYEKSMKIGLTPQISPMLIFLSNVKTAKELIISNEPIIYENVCSYIEYYCQNLSYTVIPSIVSKSSAYKTSMGKIMKVLRVLSGFYTEDDYKSENKKKSKLKIPNLSSPPHLAVLEFLRIQIQMMVNPESPFASKSGVFKSPPLSDSDIKDLQAFLSDSKYFNELICLSDTLLTVSDQSNLFFKEYYLSADGSSFFPVTTSLPYIFSEYAMDNYQKPELTGVILNPLSIYDDAASKSLRYLRSKYLYEEIKEESKICLMSITRKLADSAFHPMRRFASIRAFRKVVVDEALGQKKTNTLKENISVMRLGIILQQNRLCLLGCFIDTKSLITERLNDIFDEEITQIIDFIGKQGIRAVIAMSRLILVLKRVHGIMVNFGLPLLKQKII